MYSACISRLLAIFIHTYIQTYKCYFSMAGSVLGLDALELGRRQAVERVGLVEYE